MSKSKLELQSRNSKKSNRNKRPKNIYDLAENFVSSTVDLDILTTMKHISEPEIIYQNLINYGLILEKFLSEKESKFLKSLELNPKTPLSKVIYDLETHINSRYYCIDYSLFIEEDLILIQEYLDAFNNTLYDFDFGIYYSDIDEVLKKAILCVFKKFILHYNENFYNNLKDYYAYELESVIEYIKEDDSISLTENEFKSKIKENFDKTLKLINKVNEFTETEIDRNFIFDDDLKNEIFENALYCLDFDLKVIDSFRDDYYEDEVISFSNIFISKFIFDKFSNLIFQTYTDSKIDELNNYGVELLYTYHQVSKNSVNTFGVENIEKLIELEYKLISIMRYVDDNKKNYE